MANTTNLNLVKLSGSEKLKTYPTSQAGNMDIIDAALGAGFGANSKPSVNTSINNLADGLAIVANGNTHAAITSGQFVYVRNHGSLSEGLYVATANISANGTLSGSNLTADTAGGLNALNDNKTNFSTKLNFTTLPSTNQQIANVDVVPQGNFLYVGNTQTIDAIHLETSTGYTAFKGDMFNTYETINGTTNSQGNCAISTANSGHKVYSFIPDNDSASYDYYLFYSQGEKRYFIHLQDGNGTSQASKTVKGKAYYL